MNSQQIGNTLLRFWQAQHAMGIKPENRVLPVGNDNRSMVEFDADLEVIRQCIARKS